MLFSRAPSPAEWPPPSAALAEWPPPSVALAERPPHSAALIRSDRQHWESQCAPGEPPGGTAPGKVPDSTKLSAMAMCAWRIREVICTPGNLIAPAAEGQSPGSVVARVPPRNAAAGVSPKNTAAAHRCCVDVGSEGASSIHAHCTPDLQQRNLHCVCDCDCSRCI